MDQQDYAHRQVMSHNRSSIRGLSPENAKYLAEELGCKATTHKEQSAFLFDYWNKQKVKELQPLPAKKPRAPRKKKKAETQIEEEPVA